MFFPAGHFDSTIGTRIGEADNPGPQDVLRIAQINPAAILNKVQDLVSLQCHVYMLAENSATVSVQHEAGPLEPRLREWAFRCEQAVDCALRQRAKDDVNQAPNHLPKKHRGRNVPRHIQQRPLIMNITTACHGQYNPVIEAASMKLKHWVRQTRRLQSYARRLQKIHLSTEATDIQHQLLLEWNAIAQAHGFGAGFPQWCADIPELGWYPFRQPPLDYVQLASELLRFHCDDMAHHERKARAANNKFLKHYDVTSGSLKLLCKNVRPTPMPCLAQVQQTSTFAYILHSRQHGLVHLHAVDHPDLFPGRSVQIVQTARDLGYMLHYGSSHSRATQRERRQKAVEKLQRLRRQHAPMQAKAQVCRHAITQAMFATETYAVGRHWVRDLRSHIARTLSPNRRNTNPYLALALLSEHVIDPELFLLEASIKACRVIMFSLPAATRDRFLKIAAQHGCDPLKVRGPAGALAYNLSQLGWQLDHRGHLLTDSAVEFNLFEAPWPSIRKYLHKQFLQHALLTQVIKPGLRYAPLPDAASTIKVLTEFDPKDQQLLSYHLTGANMLATQTRHFTDSEGKCPLCQADDSEEHRLLHCPSLSHVRAEHPDAIQFLSEADPIHLLLPVIYDDPAWQFDWLVTNSLEPPELNPAVLDMLSHFEEDNRRLVCYTDGSCSPPNAPMCARAAFAVVAHMSSTAEELKQDVEYFLEHRTIPDSFHTLTVGYCHGAQTIQRAETQAVLTLTELETACDIHTDSQYVLNWAHTLGHLLYVLQFINRANFDLLRRLWSSLQSGVVRLYKVKAHDLKPKDDPLQLTIHKLGNEAADQAAKAAQRRFHTVAPPTASVSQLTEDKERLRQQFRYRLALHRARADLVSCQQAVQQQPDAYQTWAMKHAQLAQWKIDEPYTLEFSPDELAMMQLYKISAQRGLVINSADQSERQIFIPKEIELNDTQVPFTVQSFSLERCVSQIFQLLRRKLPAQRRQHCASTQILGSQHGRAGLVPRPQFPHQDKVTELMTQVLTTTSQNLDQLQVPERTPDFEVEMPEVDTTDRHDGWKDRQKRFRLHKKVSRPKV
eukprot:Skav217415  [mRNA]  locus=scaffold2674:428562:433728:- [translate_table: standard]